jgi:hypothetical protein
MRSGPCAQAKTCTCSSGLQLPSALQSSCGTRSARQLCGMYVSAWQKQEKKNWNQGQRETAVIKGAKEPQAAPYRPSTTGTDHRLPEAAICRPCPWRMRQTRWAAKACSACRRQEHRIRLKASSQTRSPRVGWSLRAGGGRCSVWMRRLGEDRHWRGSQTPAATWVHSKQ